MASSRILLAWATIGAAALLSVGTAPALPPCDLKIVSKVKQSGVTGGGAAVSTTGSTQGSGSINCVVRTPTKIVKKTAVGNAGVSGASVSAGDGAFKSLVKALTKVNTTEGGTEVKTKTSGKGATTGKAGSSQIANANGGGTLTAAEIALLHDGQDLLKVTNVKKGVATSSSDHKGSGVGDSFLKVLSKGNAEIKLKGL